MVILSSLPLGFLADSIDVLLSSLEGLVWVLNIHGLVLYVDAIAFYRIDSLVLLSRIVVAR